VPERNQVGERSVCYAADYGSGADYRKALQDELSFARDYLVELPHRIREVQEAANAVLRVGRGR
jgi:hypothetical protein